VALPGGCHVSLHSHEVRELLLERCRYAHGLGRPLVFRRLGYSVGSQQCQGLRLELLRALAPEAGGRGEPPLASPSPGTPSAAGATGVPGCLVPGGPGGGGWRGENRCRAPLPRKAP